MHTQFHGNLTFTHIKALSLVETFSQFAPFLFDKSQKMSNQLVTRCYLLASRTGQLDLNYLRQSTRLIIFYLYHKHLCANTAVKWTFTASQLDRTKSIILSTRLNLHPKQCTIWRINYIPIYLVYLTFITSTYSVLIRQLTNPHNTGLLKDNQLEY